MNKPHVETMSYSRSAFLFFFPPFARNKTRLFRRGCQIQYMELKEVCHKKQKQKQNKTKHFAFPTASTRKFDRDKFVLYIYSVPRLKRLKKNAIFQIRTDLEPHWVCFVSYLKIIKLKNNLKQNFQRYCFEKHLNLHKYSYSPLLFHLVSKGNPAFCDFSKVYLHPIILQN